MPSDVCLLDGRGLAGGAGSTSLVEISGIESSGLFRCAVEIVGELGAVAEL